jgi:hypothetical protein
MSRRLRLGLALSFVVHALVVGALVGWSWLRGAAPSRLDVEITGMELKDLPLGAPAAGASPQPRPRPRAPAPASVAKEGTLATREERRKARAGDDDGAEDAAGAGPTDLGQLGPEGSRFTMLMRLDRLKDTPYAAPVDALLMHMPDRRDLLEGTGLSFYDDFEALLLATPNPLDYTATFVAARHHVSDAGMRAAVDRGARATGRVVAWRSESGRPWGERRARAGATPTPFAARDARLIVLPAPGLVVVTPPAYRALLLAPARKVAPAHLDGGAAGAADGGAIEGADGGEREAAPSPSWAALLRRIDAETGLLPENAVAMASAVDLFQRRDNAPLVFLGVELELPRALTVVLGVEPEPFLEITATFPGEVEARRWEATWPVLRAKLRTNPYVVLSGLSTLVARLTSTRDGSTVRLRLTATEEETVRLLQVAAAALPG